MKVKTISPLRCATWLLASKRTPTCIIDFVPMVKRNVGIGWVTEEEAGPEDFKKYPVLERPWVNTKGIQ